MALNKVPYVDGVTVITAENLNDIQDAIIALENAPAQGLTEDMKQALLQLARKLAYIDDQGQTYYQDLYDALYPPKTVVLITAVFEQGSTVIYDDTALDDLKQYLTVTAKYDDNTTAILPDGAYTLSGLLEAPSSTVTVAYNGLTTTFTVNVTARPTLSSISAVYTQSDTVWSDDTIDSLKADLVVTAVYSDSTTQAVEAEDYTLSGTLDSATSTITVSYGGKTATFTVAVTLVGDTEYASDVLNFVLTNTQVSGAPASGRGDDYFWIKCLNDANITAYAVWAFDTKKTLWDTIKGKRLRIRASLKSPDWAEHPSASNNRFIPGVAIFQNSSVVSGTGRQKFAGLSPSITVLTNEYETFEYVFDATLENFSGGTGTPTASSTFGVTFYSQTLNTVWCNSVSVKEVLN